MLWIRFVKYFCQFCVFLPVKPSYLPKCGFNTSYKAGKVLFDHSFMFNLYLECFGTSIVSATIEKPIRQNLTSRDSRLDESATAVIVLQRGSLLFKYRPDWILKAISLFPTTDRLNGTYLNGTVSQRLPRITSHWNVSHQVNSLKLFWTNSNSQANRQWIILVSSTVALRIFRSQQTALISSLANCILSVWPTGLTSLSKLFISSLLESTKWLKTNLKQELDCNVKLP